MNVVQPSVVALSSGSIAIPMNRPICAYYSGSGKKGSGKLVVLGSARMFTDPYIEREKNGALQEMIFDFFDSNDTTERDIRSDDVDVSLTVEKRKRKKQQKRRKVIHLRSTT